MFSKSDHSEDRGQVQVLCLDGCTTIITHRNDRSNDELETGLLDLQLQCVDVRLILGDHCCSHELGISLWKGDLECQVRSVDLDRQLPSLDDDSAQVSASLPTNAARIEKRTKHISKLLRVDTDLR